MPNVQCMVRGCQNIGTQGFPKDNARKARWIRAIKHPDYVLTFEDLNITKNSLLCLDHFSANDFSTTPFVWHKNHPARNIIKRTAVPSILPWTPVQEQPPPPIIDGDTPEEQPSVIADETDSDAYACDNCETELEDSSSSDEEGHQYVIILPMHKDYQAFLHHNNSFNLCELECGNEQLPNLNARDVSVQTYNPVATCHKSMQTHNATYKQNQHHKSTQTNYD